MKSSETNRLYSNDATKALDELKWWEEIETIQQRQRIKERNRAAAVWQNDKQLFYYFSSLLSPPQTTDMAAMSQTSLLTLQLNQSDVILLNLMSVSGNRTEAGNLQRWGHGSSLTHCLFLSDDQNHQLGVSACFPIRPFCSQLQDDQVEVRGDELESRGSSFHVKPSFQGQFNLFQTFFEQYEEYGKSEE